MTHKPKNQCYVLKSTTNGLNITSNCTENTPQITSKCTKNIQSKTLNDNSHKRTHRNKRPMEGYRVQNPPTEDLPGGYYPGYGRFEVRRGFSGALYARVPTHAGCRKRIWAWTKM